ncbi:Protein of unknown function DUF820 [hydrothermal vent metagenome]|uniref:Putative restriction endonuclease domain-containing protein n=1 Tax=hydrothermal vent metagenome TaxID=652676 RepID=A0A3B0UVP6_9ZZZZ
MSSTQMMSTKIKLSNTQLPAIPPLEPGDRLTRREFERRYEAMPHIKKAELIEGVVYMSSPVRFASHGEPHLNMAAWIGVYKAFTPGTRSGDNVSVHLDPDNEVQPDILLRFDSTDDKQSNVSKDDYIIGAPELVVEIAASSASYDIHDKLNIYRRNGVQEYIVWQIYDERLDWFVLENEAYTPLQPDEDGVIHSQIFPGLWLAVATLLEGDMAGVLETLQQGLASKEHAEFVSHLQE